MTDTNPPADRTAEIRARLQAATLGPWHADDGDFGCVMVGNYGWVTPAGVNAPEYDVDTPQGHADAELIAHAPTDLAYLLARVEELERQLGEGEEEWAVRVFTRADQTHWFHQDARAETFEADLAMTIKTAADGTVMGTGEAPVNHGFAVVKRTVWASEWETVKTAAATGEPTTALDGDKPAEELIGPDTLCPCGKVNDGTGSGYCSGEHFEKYDGGSR